MRNSGERDMKGSTSEISANLRADIFIHSARQAVKARNETNKRKLFPKLKSSKPSKYSVKISIR